MPGTALYADDKMGACALVLCLLGIIPHELVAKDHVDVIETNHFYNEKGEFVFDQRVFYEFNSDLNQYVVADFRMIKDNRNFVAHKRLVFHDGYSLCDVRCEAVRETWTQFDPELENRKVIPIANRRKLRELIRSPYLLSRKYPGP